MVRGSTVALAAAALVLLVSLPTMMLLVSLPGADPYEQETRRLFVEWKAKYRKTYTHGGEEECRYAVFKTTRRRVAWRASRAAAGGGATTSSLLGRLNGFAATAIEEIYRGYGLPTAEEESYEEETPRMFVGWKAKYGKTYRDAGEEECRYRLFMGNRRVVVQLNNAARAGQQNVVVVYGLNQFGDLTLEEVRQRCYPEMMEDRELSARCQAAVPTYHSYQVCRCIVTEQKQITESGGSAGRSWRR